jgi:hypothetical protein
MAAGIALSISYIILPNKLSAWLLSNIVGIAWLFFYEYTVGKNAGQKRILIGLLTSGSGIAFLIVSYVVYA